jgi:hypothetical protein
MGGESVEHLRGGSKSLPLVGVNPRQEGAKETRNRQKVIHQGTCVNRVVVFV